MRALIERWLTGDGIERIELTERERALAEASQIIDALYETPPFSWRYRPGIRGAERRHQRTKSY